MADENASQTTPLERLIAEAGVLAGEPHPCAVLGHRWKHIGGSNCGCSGTRSDGSRWHGNCSVPVYECEACGDCDYGDNFEAEETRAECAEEDAHV